MAERRSAGHRAGAATVASPAPMTDVDTTLIPRIPLDADIPAPTRSARHAPTRRAPSSGLSFIARFVVLLLVAAVVTFGLRAYLVEPFWIPSQSMEPTLHGCPGCNDDRLLVNKLAYKVHGVHRGDIVVFKRPPDFNTTEKDLVKRVIGLPGETVSGHDGRVWVGNQALREPYIEPSCYGTASFSPVTVPKGEVFVMGDNRCDSSDSRVFGPIKTSSIVGRAFVVFWPLNRIHWL